MQNCVLICDWTKLANLRTSGSTKVEKLLVMHFSENLETVRGVAGMCSGIFSRWLNVSGFIFAAPVSTIRYIDRQLDS